MRWMRKRHIKSVNQLDDQNQTWDASKEHIMHRGLFKRIIKEGYRRVLSERAVRFTHAIHFMTRIQ